MLAAGSLSAPREPGGRMKELSSFGRGGSAGGEVNQSISDDVGGIAALPIPWPWPITEVPTDSLANATSTE